MTIAGDSGGGNLTLATALKAKRDGHLHMVNGACALVPLISNDWASTKTTGAPRFPSLIENDGYVLACEAMDINAAVLDPSGTHATDPLCWPLHASDEDLAGLPPHLISVNELDPLRDEGIAYYRNLTRAGVSAHLQTVPGMSHGADLMFPTQMPDRYQAAVDCIYDFAVSI